MGVKERKEKEKQERISLILKAAEKVFMIKGLENATVNDVAALAELGKGTLYLYFTSKDDILFALTTSAITDLHKAFEKALEKKQTGADKLKAIGWAYIEFCKNNPLKYQLLNFYRVQPLKPEHEKDVPNFFQCHIQSEKLFGLMIEVITEGMHDGTISKEVDPFQTALILWGTTTGIYQLMDTMGEHLEADHGLAPNGLAEMYFNLIEHSLRVFTKK